MAHAGRRSLGNHSTERSDYERQDMREGWKAGGKSQRDGALAMNVKTHVKPGRLSANHNAAVR